MPLIQDPRYTQNALVGPINSGLLLPPKESEASPSALDVLAAAARQSTLTGGAYERFIANRDPDLPDAPAGFDPLDHVPAGREQDARAYVNAQTPSDVEGINQRLAERDSDRRILESAGWGGTGAQLLMGLTDPSFLVSIGVPELALGRSIRQASAIRGALEGAAGAGVYEFGRHNIDDYRSINETLFNLGAGATLGGVLGASLVRNVPAQTRQALEAQISQEIGRSEVGAASSRATTTLEQETIAKGDTALSKGLSKTPLIGTDLDKVMNSESVVARQVFQELADVPQITAKNFEDIASPTSVEALVGKHDARIADFIDALHDDFSAYKARAKEEGFDPMSKGDFFTSVASAARRGDVSEIPEVARSAQTLRSRVFDPLWNDAKRLRIAAEPEGGVLGAESYFRRMYDREAIRANRQEWDRILSNWFAKEGADKAEITAAVEDVTRKILGADVGQSNFATKVTVPAAGPLKERTLAIPDALIERFLVNDPVKVARSYVKDLAPQVEMAKRFGDVDMKAQLQQISDDFAIQREKLRAKEGDQSKALSKLEQREKETLEAVIRVRDRILGRAGRLGADASEGTRRAVMAARGWRNWVAASRLGATAITGGAMDTAKVAATYGFLPTMRALTKLAVSPEFRAMSKAMARRVGTAVEVAMAKRVSIATDGAMTEGWTEKLANGVYKYSGLNHATDFNRTLSAVLFENQVLKFAERVAEGKALPKFEAARLASLGLSTDELKRIAKEVAKHGGEMDGMRVSGSADWNNKQLSDVYDAAILKDSKITVQQPGAADRVWWMDKELGKVLGQLKSFSLSSPTRLLAAPLQMARNGDAMGSARYLGFMMMGGYLTHVLRQLSAGKTPVTDPQQAATEAFAESGLAGVLPDIASPFARRLGLFGESVRYSDRNAASALGGPSVGALQDAWDWGMNRSQGGISASDLHLLRRMLPYNNVWYLRRAINALEGEVAEGLNLKGADTASFGERLIRTDAVLPTSQRGVTGTGVQIQ